MTNPTTKLKVINAILASPGTAPVLGAKIIGRVIGQVANGFGKDEQLVTELSIYKAIAEKYPADTITMMKMFETMKNNADTAAPGLSAKDKEIMSTEEQELWQTTDLSERDQLIASKLELTKLFISAPVDIKAWNDLPTIAQWSLLNIVEATLPNKVALYGSWADRDRLANKTATNAMRLESEAEAAIPVFFKIVTEFLANKAVAKDLENDKALGVAVPVRAVA